jgi:hypothetical protein
MFRTLRTVFLTFCLLSLSSFQIGGPSIDDHTSIYNSTLDRLFHPELHRAPLLDAAEESLGVDTTVKLRILMLDYSSYGSAYNEKVRRIIQRYLPKTVFADFTEGTVDELSKALAGSDAVVIAYASAAESGIVKSYCKALNQFVQSGGSVVFTGTHEYEVLRQFGLFELDYGYFSKDIPLHAIHPEHPVFQGIVTDVTLSNYAYPLDISDPGFVTLADVGGYPVIGYKPVGSGKIMYLGVEYYFDEIVSTNILIHALLWSSKDHETSGMTIAAAEPLKHGGAKRSEELLLAGSGLKSEQIDLKIYPNPYYSKATLDIELFKPTPLMVEMTDESGRNVAIILPKKTIGPGLCRFDLPNITSGIYFLQVHLGDKTYVRKVVKLSSN